MSTPPIPPLPSVPSMENMDPMHPETFVALCAEFGFVCPVCRLEGEDDGPDTDYNTAFKLIDSAEPLSLFRITTCRGCKTLVKMRYNLSGYEILKDYSEAI